MISPADIRLVENCMLSMTLSLPRIFVCFFWIPIFAASIFPKTFRVAIALGFAIPVAASVSHSLRAVDTVVPIVALLFKESILGLLLGFSLSAPFWAVEAVGALFDQQRGANTAQQVTPFATADLSMIGAVLRMALVVFLIATGGLIPLYEILLTSFDVWPVMTLVPDLGGFGTHGMIVQFTEFVRLAVLYSAPILVVLGLIDLAFALIGLFSPQLPTYFAAMPVKSIVGMFILVVYISILLQHGRDYFWKAIELDVSTLKAVQPGR